MVWSCSDEYHKRAKNAYELPVSLSILDNRGIIRMGKWSDELLSHVATLNNSDYFGWHAAK